MLREEMFQKFNNKIKNINVDSKILLLTHNDLDGEGASIIMKYFFHNVEVRYCSNSKMDEEINNACVKEYKKYDYIFIIDISCKENTAEYINNHRNIANKVILLDHHITAMNLNKYDFCSLWGDNPEDGFSHKYFKNKNINGHASGTTLLLDFLYYNGIPDRVYENIDKFAFNIGIYDTWDWVKIFNKVIFPKELNKLFDLYGCQKFEENILEKLNNNISDFNLDNIDRMLLDIDNLKCEEYIERKAKGFRERVVTINNEDYKICIGIGEQYLDELFDKMEEYYPLVDFYAIYTGFGISLRSRENALHKEPIDVSKIAKYLGGGGHKEAAGIKISQNILNDFFDHFFTKIPITSIGKDNYVYEK